MEDDFKVLLTLEKHLVNREYVPLQLIEKTSGIHEEKLQLIVKKLQGLNLVRSETITGEKMFRLTYLGYDMLAIRALAKSNMLEAIGDRIGVGKESEIYMGLAPGGTQVAVKFLRIGRTSFRQTVRVRAWVRNKPFSTWYEQSKIAAEREFKAVKELISYKAYVPNPIGYNRHVVVVEYIDGTELYTRPFLEDPDKVLEKILFTLTLALHRAGIVHGDLSEYNVIVRKSNEDPFIIDWPQYVYKDDPSAIDLLKRDIYYIVKFFNKVYGTRLDPESAFDKVLKGVFLN
ncbi:MAG: lipopolysaccharide core heptose(II) kinase RfaY [Desulfurococcaceae archaeon]